MYTRQYWLPLRGSEPSSAHLPWRRRTNKPEYGTHSPRIATAAQGDKRASCTNTRPEQHHKRSRVRAAGHTTRRTRRGRFRGRRSPPLQHAHHDSTLLLPPQHPLPLRHRAALLLPRHDLHRLPHPDTLPRPAYALDLTPPSPLASPLLPDPPLRIPLPRVPAHRPLQPLPRLHLLLPTLAQRYCV